MSSLSFGVVEVESKHRILDLGHVFFGRSLFPVEAERWVERVAFHPFQQLRNVGGSLLLCEWQQEPAAHNRSAKTQLADAVPVHSYTEDSTSTAAPPFNTLVNVTSGPCFFSRG